MVFFAALALAAAAVAFVAFRQLRARPDIPVRFAFETIAVAALHALLLTAVWRRWRMRGALVYLAASAALLAAAGGTRHASALLVLGGTAFLLGAVGRRIGKLLLPDAALTPGISLGLGIAAVSWAISAALLAGVFGLPFLAALAVAAIAIAVPALRSAAADFRSAIRDAGPGTPALAAALELAFLLGAALAARALAPESGYDALTRYLPWLKTAARTGSFPRIPWQFPFILPQAGLAWASALAFDPMAQRAAMLAAVAVCAAIVAARGRQRIAAPDEDPTEKDAPLRESGIPPAIAALVALTVASCPLVLLAAHGVQPDPFGWIVLLLLAVAASDADPRRIAFWPACGALAALAWCAKYSTAGFAALLLVHALRRATEAEGWRKAIAKAVVGGGAGAALAGGPWLVNAFRLSRNPVFPLLSSIFPSPLWRTRIDSVWRGGFAFGKGLRAWLLLPIDMTIHTNRFAEDRPGSFGLTLLAILLLGAIGAVAARRTERVWLAAAAAGTLAVWTQTPLVRYWIPALWLAAPAAARGAEAVGGWIGRRAVGAGLAAIVVLQTALAAFSSKADLEGRRWAVFTGRTSEVEYVGRMPGASALARLAAIDPTFPKVWYSGLYAVGHADVIPLMAERWELAFHVRVEDRAALFRYVDSVGCRYWAVASSLPDRAEFERLGIAERYWRPSAIVVMDTTTTIYRMPPP